jgi:ribose 5-phosphate isomerase B
MIDERTIREMVRKVVLRTVQAAAESGGAHGQVGRGTRLVTQADVENVQPGQNLRVPEGAIVTPLARQAALERRVDIQTGDVAPMVAGAGDGSRTVGLAADHGGFEMKEDLAAHLASRGFSVIDCGTHGREAVDYPDFALAAARLVAQGKARAAIVVDGAGIGSCMAANKVPGVRAAMCYDEATAVNSREHNDANVLTLGAGLIGGALAKRIVDTWLDTPHGGGRHARRVGKITDIERRYLKG